MNDRVDNLIREHLKPFQAGQDRIERKMEEVTRRLSNLEAGQASIIQHRGHFASADAQQQLASDGFDQRLERIERRFELARGPTLATGDPPDLVPGTCKTRSGVIKYSPAQLILIQKIHARSP